jgi:tetratricopeptide (TPR) repeat protein
MQFDQQGLPLHNANAKGADLFRIGLDQFTTFNSSLFATLDGAIGENPDFAMPYFAKAYINLIMTEPQFRDVAVQAMAALRSRIDPSDLTPTERAHAAAIDSWIGGDWRQAAAILDRLGIDQPRDILALRAGHELDFFVGDSRSLRDRIARHLQSWSDSDHHAGIVYGCYAFGLEEMGHFERAEEFGYRALAKNRNDVWAIHAVAHAYEMRAMLNQGIEFMTAREKDWMENNLFTAHNSWHRALFHLDRGNYAEALQTYDSVLFNHDSAKVALVLLDAASLLWRLYLEGADLGDRFQTLADAWQDHLPEEPYYVFNDVHATLASIGAGRLERADQIVARLENYLRGGNRATNNYRNCESVGLPICKALVAFGRMNYGDAASLLYAVRGHAHAFGGSAAQRDIIDRTLLEAALRGQDSAMASAIASERIHLKPASPGNWRKAAQALRLCGKEDKAVAADVRSAELSRAASGAKSSVSAL